MTQDDEIKIITQTLFFEDVKDITKWESDKGLEVRLLFTNGNRIHFWWEDGILRTELDWK